MILSRNAEGHIVRKPTARQLARMSVEAKREEHRPYSLPPPSRFSVDESPATNEEADEITRYFDAQQRIKQAAHRLNQVSQQAPLDSALSIVRKQTLRTYLPTAAEVQEAFYQSQINPNYFEENAPNTELMRGLAALYAEKQLPTPKPLKQYEVKRLASKTTTQTEESNFIRIVAEKVRDIARRKTYTSRSAVVYAVDLLDELLQQLQETEFAFYPDKKEELSRSIEEAINSLNTAVVTEDSMLQERSDQQSRYDQANGDDLSELERAALGVSRQGRLPDIAEADYPTLKSTLSINKLKGNIGTVKTLDSPLPELAAPYAHGRPSIGGTNTALPKPPRRAAALARDRMVAAALQAESSSEGDAAAAPATPAKVARERARLARLQKLRDQGEEVSDTAYPGVGKRRKANSDRIRLGIWEMPDTDTAMQTVRSVRARIAEREPAAGGAGAGGAAINRRLAAAFNAED